MTDEVAVGDVWRMRRRHPCGSWEWRVYRIGADIGLVCLGCGRRVMLERRRFEQRAGSRVSAAS
ncbi:MAG: DUF951 domain-containing protein [Chloroflexi bacterium]|nr:DUF951 domain-containing protein [Chloroflexota bacterium]